MHTLPRKREAVQLLGGRWRLTEENTCPLGAVPILFLGTCAKEMKTCVRQQALHANARRSCINNENLEITSNACQQEGQTKYIHARE